MKRLKLIVCLLTLFVGFPAGVKAQTPAVTIVIDKTTIAQAAANGVAATASETAIKKEYEEMKEQQIKVEGMLIIVEQHLNKVEKVLQDISAFKKEGAAIRLFVFKTKKALNSLSGLMSVATSNEIGVVASYNKYISVVSDIYSICNDMVSTVIDAKFALPGLSRPKPKEQMNLLEPQERLAFYERCSYEMDIINYKLQGLQYAIMSNNTLSKAAAKLAPQSYWTVEYGKSIANEIINLWKK